MSLIPNAAAPCSTRRSAFGRGSASSRRTGAGGGGDAVELHLAEGQGVVVERHHHRAAERAVDATDPQGVADRRAVHLAHVPQAPAAERHAVGGDEVGVVEEEEIHVGDPLGWFARERAPQPRSSG